MFFFTSFEYVLLRDICNKSRLGKHSEEKPLIVLHTKTNFCLVSYNSLLIEKRKEMRDAELNVRKNVFNAPFSITQYDSDVSYNRCDSLIMVMTTEGEKENIVRYERIQKSVLLQHFMET